MSQKKSHQKNLRRTITLCSKLNNNKNPNKKRSSRNQNNNLPLNLNNINKRKLMKIPYKKNENLEFK